MRKLQLRIDELTVESFEMLADRNAPGTVQGNEGEDEGSLYQTCKQWDTCEGNKTCNLGGECYTFEGGFTCNGVEAACDPTYDATCTCPEFAAN